MERVDRLGALLSRSAAVPDPLLVVYLTLGDPLGGGCAALALAAVQAGADVIELGIPTLGTRPRGLEVRESFLRARGTSTAELWQQFRRLREATPATPLLPLAYPETARDLGWDALLTEATAAGADGMVLTRPWQDQGLQTVASAGVSAIPVLSPSAGADEISRAESAASHLTYRALADGTGLPLDLTAAQHHTQRLARTAAKPFLVGFGVRTTREIRALAPHAAGVVIGSELLKTVRTAAPDDRAAVLRRNVHAWKAATKPSGTPDGNQAPPGPGPPRPTPGAEEQLSFRA